jgi:hypothetical protein
MYAMKPKPRHDLADRSRTPLADQAVPVVDEPV